MLFKWEREKPGARLGVELWLTCWVLTWPVFHRDCLEWDCRSRRGFRSESLARTFRSFLRTKTIKVELGHWILRECIQLTVKYVLPMSVPLFFPLGSSSTTPTHRPAKRKEDEDIFHLLSLARWWVTCLRKKSIRRMRLFLWSWSCSCLWPRRAFQFSAASQTLLNLRAWKL